MTSLTFGGLGTLFDGPHATPTRREDGPYFLNISSLDSGRLDLSVSDHVDEDDYRKWTRRVVPEPGDLLFSYETRLGEAALMPEGVRACLGRRMALLRPNRKVVDPRFLLYFYLSPAFQETIRERSIHGATVERILLSNMGEWPVRIPGLTTQRAIAEILGALDDKIAVNSRVADAAERLARVIYTRATRQVGRVPSSARLVPVLGGTPDRGRFEFWDGDVPWVSAKDITGAPSGLILETAEGITSEGVAGSRAKPVPEGSVILTARGTVGAVARLGVSAAFNQSCYAFCPSPEVGAACLYFMVRDAAADALSVSHGSVFSTITMRSFDALSVPDLSLLQLAVLESELEPLLRVVESRVRESLRLATLRDTLLPHLMSGRLTVGEAEKRVEEVQ